MNIAVPAALFGWIPFILFLFSVLSARRAVIAAFIIAWLFLPNIEYVIGGLPNYSKVSATSAGVLLATLLFNPSQFLRYRPHWADLPMLVWCLVPFASSTANGLGAYDGVSAVVTRFVIWGIAYFIGRIYFTDWAALRELGIGIVLGGLVYMPLCLYEIRMSPQLHNMVYGYGMAWHNVRRGGGWRPTVFMKDGLMLGMWMSMTALVAVWLWRSGTIRRLWRVSFGWLALGLAVTAVLCKSTGATALLVFGLVVLFVAQRWRSRAVVLAVMALPVLYMYTRSVGGWDGQLLLDGAALISEERRGSMEFRFHHEDILVSHALRQSVFGWGGWGRNRPSGEDVERTVTDGMWVIAIGMNGLVGLVAITAAQLVPLLLFMWQCPPRQWRHPLAGVPAALGMMLVMHCIDNLFNAMINPIYMLSAGAVTGLAVALQAHGRSKRYATPAGARLPATPANPALTRPSAPGWAPGASGSR
jgi:hypothetical protein